MEPELLQQAEKLRQGWVKGAEKKAVVSGKHLGEYLKNTCLNGQKICHFLSSLIIP